MYLILIYSGLVSRLSGFELKKESENPTKGFVSLSGLDLFFYKSHKLHCRHFEFEASSSSSSSSVSVFFLRTSLCKVIVFGFSLLPACIRKYASLLRLEFWIRVMTFYFLLTTSYSDSYLSLI